MNELAKASLLLIAGVAANTSAEVYFLPSAAVRLGRPPDVRCVVADCFRPPRTREEMREQQRFKRRLLSPRGRGRIE